MNKLCQYCGKPINGETSISISAGNVKDPPIFHTKCFERATKEIVKNLKSGTE